MPREYRQFFLELQPAAIRTATFDNKEHFVVPVIALVEGVLHAINSPYPELVLAEEFSQAPQGWNGRPVVGDHPIRNGQRVSANLPEVLESESFGLVFNSGVKNKALHMEAWLDPRRAEAVGKDALEVIERVRNLEAIEVSVGAFVGTEEAEGEYEGQKYKGIWRDIVPDHLAMLPKGAIGACSVEMGCGAPRAASLYTLSSSGYTLVEAQGCACNKESTQMPTGNAWQQYKEKLKDLMGKFTFRLGQQEDDMSDMDVREMLSSELQSSEPGFLGVEAVFLNADPKNVVFAADPEGPLQFFRRSFTMGEKGVITLGDDKEEVRHVVRFEPVTSGDGSNDEEPKTNQGVSEEMDEAKKARIQALIASDRNSFVEGDLEYMGTFSDERLAQLEAQAQVQEPEEEEQVIEVNDEAPQEMSEEEKEAVYLRSAPQSVRNLVARAKEEEKTKRNVLTSLLKNSQSAFCEKDLAAMSVEQLEKLASALSKTKPSSPSLVDFSGKGGPRTASSGEDSVPEPPSIVERLKSRNSA